MKRRAFIATTAFSMAYLGTSAYCIPRDKKRNAQTGRQAGRKSSRSPDNLPEYVRESPRDIPLVDKVDVLVAGGTTAAVTAATAAARKGANVFLIAPKPYLGEDMCTTLRLQLELDEQPDSHIGKSIFGHKKTTTPLRVKKVLEDTLLRSGKSGVRFILASHITEILHDASGKPAGVVMVNRAGRQAVIAKTIIDATDRAAVAEMAGAGRHPWPGGNMHFSRTVLMPSGDQGFDITEHRLELPMPDNSISSFACAELSAREKTYRQGQLRSSESLFHVPPDPVICNKTAGEWKSGALPDQEHFRPRGSGRIYVLSGCADIPRDQAAILMKPCGMVKTGERIGQAAAVDAERLAEPEGTFVYTRKNDHEYPGDITEVLRGLRPTDRNLPLVYSNGLRLPVFGRYDVLVVGGGTSGASAAIGAARSGAGTLVVEYLEGLGGIGTLGLITRPYHGRKAGFSGEVPFIEDPAIYNIEDKMEWYRAQVKGAGADIWLGVMGCGTYVEKGRVKGAVISTPQHRGVILANTVIDATSNGDMAVAAGAGHMYGGNEEHIALQGTGLPPRPLFRHYMNTDYLLVDESDMTDVTRAFAGARKTMDEINYDCCTMIDNRERRRIKGEHVLSYLDQILERTHPDTIVLSASDYDSHGYPVREYFALLPHDEESRKKNHPAPGGTSHTPYRCLLPEGLDGILVTGLAISMERDASAMVRMQFDMANQGYAAGVAAAMAAKNGITVRGIDVKKLQRHLVDKGNLPEEVLSHEDSFPLAKDAIRNAVREFPDATNPESGGKPLAIILSHRETALPMLQEAWKAASGVKRLTYAKIMGILGDKAVVPELIDAVNGIREWDEKILQGGMAEYAHLPTPKDALILALGYTGDSRGLPVLREKLEILDAQTTLSHHRSVALALEHIGHPDAARPIADLLQKPGMRGHAMTGIEPLYDKVNGSMDMRRRTGPLREILYARVLYRCGDYKGLGEKILKEYLDDVRGLLSRHARAVLDAGGEYRPKIYYETPITGPAASHCSKRKDLS